MVERGHEVHLLHSESRADPDLLAEIRGLPGVRCQAFDMRREIGLDDLCVVWSLMRYLRKWGPFDVIHGHSAKGGGYARQLGILLPGRRSEERRGGKEGGSTCRSRWSPYH